uniref:Uncharacterized protein n=1 Tax=Anguilla anguilla TaxID=7936 RepID=A0A0E9WHD2_ANGAN
MYTSATSLNMVSLVMINQCSLFLCMQSSLTISHQKYKKREKTLKMINKVHNYCHDAFSNWYSGKTVSCIIYSNHITTLR